MHSVVLKSIDLFWTLNGSFTNACFVTLFIDHWENILVYWLIQIFWILTHFIIQYQKKFVTITTNLIRKAFKCWEIIKFTVVNSSFPNSLQGSNERQKISSVVFLVVTGLFIYLKKCWSNTQSDNSPLVSPFFK